MYVVSKESELQKLVNERDSYIAQLTRKVNGKLSTNSLNTCILIFTAKDKQITGLICQLESLQKKQHFDSSQLVHQNVHFTLGKLILT